MTRIIIEINGDDVKVTTEKEETEHKSQEKTGDGLGSQYARFFDETCPGWERDTQWNLTFLRDQQRYANDLLRVKGHLFLNDVYEMLGIPKSKAGQVVGWVYDPENPMANNYVDFGLGSAKNREAIDLDDTTLLLDFNVDGVIIDRI